MTRSWPVFWLTNIVLLPSGAQEMPVIWLMPPANTDSLNPTSCGVPATMSRPRAARHRNFFMGSLLDRLAPETEMENPWTMAESYVANLLRIDAGAGATRAGLPRSPEGRSRRHPRRRPSRRPQGRHRRPPADRC